MGALGEDGSLILGLDDEEALLAEEERFRMKSSQVSDIHENRQEWPPTSELARIAVASADQQEKQRQRDLERKQAQWFDWLSQKQFIIRAAERYLDDWLEYGEWQRTTEPYVRLREKEFPSPHRYDPREPVKLLFEVDGILLELWSHWRPGEYVDHPFEKWSIFALHYSDEAQVVEQERLTAGTTLGYHRGPVKVGGWVRTQISTFEDLGNWVKKHHSPAFYGDDEPDVRA